MKARFAPAALRRLRMTLMALAVVLLPQIAAACPVCFGDPNSNLMKGVNNGVLFLIGIVAFVQIGFIALFVTFWRRARALARRREKFHLVQ